MRIISSWYEKNIPYIFICQQCKKATQLAAHNFLRWANESYQRMVHPNNREQPERRRGSAFKEIMTKIKSNKWCIGACCGRVGAGGGGGSVTATALLRLAKEPAVSSCCSDASRSFALLSALPLKIRHKHFHPSGDPTLLQPIQCTTLSWQSWHQHTSQVQSTNPVSQCVWQFSHQILFDNAKKCPDEISGKAHAC